MNVIELFSFEDFRIENFRNIFTLNIIYFIIVSDGNDWFVILFVALFLKALVNSLGYIMRLADIKYNKLGRLLIDDFDEIGII